MDETGVLGLLEELSILLEDSKPVGFGRNGNMRQVDIAAAMDIMDEIREVIRFSMYIWKYLSAFPESPRL